MARQRKPKQFNTRTLVDTDGFRWWLEEDREAWPQHISALKEQGL